MIHRLLADAVLALHLAFILFVALGGFLVLRRPRLAWLHTPVFLWGAAIEFGGWICPLTPLEKWLRERGGEGAYAGGFIEHYVTALIYPAGLTRNLQLLIGAGVLAINAAIYLRLWQRRRARGQAR
ncbi:MAG: DUF2784 domain-containing protein [Steroidobacteraceae bacterium]